MVRALQQQLQGLLWLVRPDPARHENTPQLLSIEGGKGAERLAGAARATSSAASLLALACSASGSSSSPPHEASRSPTVSRRERSEASGRHSRSRASPVRQLWGRCMSATLPHPAHVASPARIHK